MSRHRHVLKFAAAATALSAGLAVVAATPASAVTPGKIMVCAQGNYHAEAVFPDANNYRIQVPKGTCITPVTNPVGRDTLVQIYGVYNTSNKRFRLGDAWLPQFRGLDVYTKGRTNAPYIEVYN